MGKTKDYLDYLNNERGISPASSQEELDCAQSLADIFSSYGLDPQVQEFSAPALGAMPYGVTMVLLFLGVLLAGLGGAMLVVGILLVAAAVAVLFMRRSGNDVLAKVGPKAHSQNVVAVRRAEGTEAERERPVIVIAHYDTQRLDLLSRPGVSTVKRYLAQVSPYVTVAVAVCTLVQILVFLPAGLRRALWVIGIVAALPMLVWGVALVAGRFLPYANGAVDNKSSVAAMLGVLDRVMSAAPAPAVPSQEHEDEAAPAPAAPVQDSIVRPAPRKEPAMRKEVEEVRGVRHGEHVLRALGILPETCEITYIAPEVRMVPVAEEIPAEHPADLTQVQDAGATTEMSSEDLRAQALRSAPTSEMEALRPAPEQEAPAAGPVAGVVASGADAGDGADSPAAQPAAGSPADEDAPVEVPVEAPVSDETLPIQPARPLERAPEAAPAKPGPSAADARATVAKVEREGVRAAKVAFSKFVSVAERLRHLENGQRTDEGPTVETDQSGLSTMASEDANEAADATRSERPAPEAVDDPEWGKSTFQPRKAAAPAPDWAETVPEAEAPDADATQRMSTGEQAEGREAAADSTNELHRQPGVSSVARRAALFDLPDPLEGSSDALSSPIVRAAAPTPRPSARTVPAIPSVDVPTPPAPTTPQADPMAQRLAAAGRPATPPAPVRIEDEYEVPESPSRASAAPAPDIKVLSADSIQQVAPQEEAPSAGGKRHRLSGLFGHKQRQRQESMSEWLGVDEDYNAKDGGEDIGSWDNFNSDQPASGRGHWKGGATAGSVDAAEEELRDAVLSMEDDRLRFHDVWFVATGASALGHAGVKHFVEEHRRDLRGAFVVNLECIGAGNLTLLTREGFGVIRRSDRRCGGLLSAVAADLHIPLGKEDRIWADTEATPIMRKSLRAVTIIGLDAADLPAFSRTDGDVPENVSVRQVEDVSALLTEMIRRA